MDHRFSEGSNIVLDCFACLARLADIYHAYFSYNSRETKREQLDTYVLQVKRDALKVFIQFSLKNKFSNNFIFCT